ncbi:hypothetical protein P153DRAFT_398794 [Dothidotthia symphoricarpi CBS 119687]|uniref:Protein HRI1 n=1 Tax=Dothidotthia symphoricarpi CBS 119687 TaxID=1392245 RepID=A0A6A6A655_9PLEO|nr:uncharacterized protein P153DRAFT_398794 [Dothidotthia symphoricarpi CBS 119687]KAF2127462.1 hypothetical protein P153DRAFT_398794 [Dothidotthia symphoricarpi CBS 119687]
MASPTIAPPGEVIVENKNRSHLQTILQLSGTLKSPNLSLSNPTVTFTISARQTWSAHPDRPLTICTRHTPLDMEVPGRNWTGDFFSWWIASLEKGSWKPLNWMPPATIRCSKQPSKEDWQQILGFVTIPSLESGQVYTVDRELDISSLPEEHTLTLSKGETVHFRLEGNNFRRSPGIEWWNWGDLNPDFKGKKLGYRGDPWLNDKDREEERKLLPPDLVLGYENWRDPEDDDGNEMVWLEMEFDETPMCCQVVE